MKKFRVVAAFALSAVLGIGAAVPVAAAPEQPDVDAPEVVEPIVEEVIVEEVTATTAVPPVTTVAPPTTLVAEEEPEGELPIDAPAPEVSLPSTTVVDEGRGVAPGVAEAPLILGLFVNEEPAPPSGPDETVPQAPAPALRDLPPEWTWTPPPYPPFIREECVEYQLEKHSSTWSAETGEWSAWVVRTPPVRLGWGIYPANPTGHLSGDHEQDGDQHYAYLVVGERPDDKESCAPEYPPTEVVERGDCETGQTVVTEKTTTTTYVAEFRDGVWVPVAQSPTVVNVERPLNEAEQAECAPEYPPTEVVERGDCETGQTVVTEKTTTTTYVAEFRDGVWVPVAQSPTVVNVERPLNEAEQAECAPEYEPLVERIEGNCATGDTSVFVTVQTTTYKAVYSEGAWVQEVDAVSAVGSDRVFTAAEQAECSPPVSETETEWVDGTFECEDTTVVQTRTLTTTPFVYVLSDSLPGAEWVLDTANAVTVTEERVRELEPEEITVCPFIDFAVLGPVCIGNIPFINWTVIGGGFDESLPLTITISQQGNVIQTIENAPYDGQVVWPGASVDPEDWPGWRLNEDGIWIEDPSDAVLREPLTVTGSVNPDASGTVEYPPSSAECVEPPPNEDPPGEDPPVTTPPPTTVVTPQLPATGSEMPGILMLASMILLLGGTTLLVGRRRTAG